MLPYGKCPHVYCVSVGEASRLPKKEKIEGRGFSLLQNHNAKTEPTV